MVKEESVLCLCVCLCELCGTSAFFYHWWYYFYFFYVVKYFKSLFTGTK